MSETTKDTFNYKKIAQAKVFKWMAFCFAIYLIVNGAMLVYESSMDAQYDTTTNISLISVGTISIVLSAILLIAEIYVEKHHPGVSLSFFYAVMIMVMFGTTVGTISVINGVDVPNSGSRGTLGWVFGGITTAIGVLGFLWTVFALIITYHPEFFAQYRFAKWAILDDKEKETN